MDDKEIIKSQRGSLYIGIFCVMILIFGMGQMLHHVYYDEPKIDIGTVYLHESGFYAVAFSNSGGNMLKSEELPEFTFNIITTKGTAYKETYKMFEGIRYGLRSIYQLTNIQSEALPLVKQLNVEVKFRGKIQTKSFIVGKSLIHGLGKEVYFLKEVEDKSDLIKS